MKGRKDGYLIRRRFVTKLVDLKDGFRAMREIAAELRIAQDGCGFLLFHFPGVAGSQ
jgi:hypothetical protein